MSWLPRTATEPGAHAAGQLLGRAGTSDVIDAVVTQTAAGLRADVVTGDRADIARLLRAALSSSQIIDLQDRRGTGSA